MANDSFTTNETEEFRNGIIDVLGVADLVVNEVVYLSGNDEITGMPDDVTEANARKYLGWAVRPYDFSEDNRASIQSRYHRRVERTAGGTIAAGQDVKFEYATGALTGQVIVWTPGTDDADQIVGKCIVGGNDTDTVEILEV